MDSNSNTDSSVSGLRRYLSPLGAWSLVFGSAVGWGSFVMPGTTFLPLAGPIGAVIGFAVGTVVMMLVGINYFYMMGHYPDAGGTYSYAKNVFGHDHAFLNAWFLILVYLAIIWANATAISIVFRNFLGDALQWGLHYRLAGFDVYLSEALLSILFLVAFGLLCMIGGRKMAVVQIGMALLLFIGVMFGLCAAFAKHGLSLLQSQPLFNPERHWLLSIIGIAVLVPWAVAGFESISHSAEEIRFPAKRTFSLLMLSLIIIGVTYIALVLIAVSEIGKVEGGWLPYVRNLDSFTGIEQNPVLLAVKAQTGNAGLLLFAFAIIAGVATGLVGNYVAASRILYAMAKDDILPAWFGCLNRRKTPQNAILFIMLFSLPIPFFGRTAISWIVDVTVIGATVAYLYTSAIALTVARREGNRLVQATGITGTILSALFIIYYLIPNVWSVNGLSKESYLILIVWSILGFACFKYLFDKDGERRRFGKSIVTWVVMLSILFSITILWLRTANIETTNKVLNNLSEYDLQELQEHGVQLTETDKEEAKEFIRRQMTIVNNSFKYNNILQMALIALALYIMFNIYRAITRREKNLELEKAHEIQRNKAKSAFLSRMSHDMRTPLNAVLGYAGIALKMDGLTPSIKEYLLKIETSGQHLLALINDILEMSRIESGKIKFDIVPVDLTKAMNDIRLIFEIQMEAKNISYSINTIDVNDKYVLCDLFHINRIFLNLVSNAYKFTPEGGAVSVTLKQLCRIDGNDGAEPRGKYELRVKDTGIGMSPEFKSKIFEAYERDDSAGSIQGTGLGMAITKNLIDLMGGTIEVVTEVGKGTEFIITIEFPLAPEIQGNTDSQEDVQVEAQDFSNVRLLLVDDNEINREIASMILEEAGFILDEAENGKEAVEKIKASNPGDYQAVLMDVQMPVMNGYEASREIRALQNRELATIPIVAMTANAFVEDVEKAKAAGMNAHVPKPIDVAKLMATLADILSSRKTS